MTSQPVHAKKGTPAATGSLLVEPAARHTCNSYACCHHMLPSAMTTPPSHAAHDDDCTQRMMLQQMQSRGRPDSIAAVAMAAMPVPCITVTMTCLTLELLIR